MANENDRLLGRQIAAARVLVGLSIEQLARDADIPMEELRQIEATSGVAVGPAERIDAVRHVLEGAGAVFIAEDSQGAGVRLKFNRLETRQIGRWEGEGGSVGSDEVP
jgi:hypothetical protein